MTSRFQGGHPYFRAVFEDGLLLGSDSLPGACCKCTAKERSADEYPEVLEGCTACEDCRADGTCGVHGSTGEVDAHQVDEDEAEADCKACRLSCTELGISCTKDYQHEDEGCYNLYEACTPYAAGSGDAVCAETCGICTQECHTGLIHEFCKQQKESTGDDAADYLTYPVATGVFPAHAAAQGNAQGDGGIDVAAAYFTDGVCHCNDGKTKSDCGGEESGGSAATYKHCGSAAKECKNERSYAFSDVLFHKRFSFSSCEQI